MNPYDVKTALLGGIIDYAGTFPPAALSLDKALQRAAYWRRESKHPWLYGRVALPLEDLKKLKSRALYQAGADGAPWVFTALGNAATKPEAAEFLRCVEWDVREIRRCRERWEEGPLRMDIVGYETKVPGGVNRKNLSDFLTPSLDRLVALDSRLTPYLEMAWEDDWEGRLVGFSTVLSAWAEDQEGSGVVPAIKVRTGGAFTPSPEQLATVIEACVTHGLRFKATQGLHSCLTHGKDLGFVNLMLSLSFAQALGPDDFGKKQIAELLSVSDSQDIRWEKEQISWKSFSIETEAIEASRRRHGGCFGSCSLDEPDESLSQLFSEEK